MIEECVDRADPDEADHRALKDALWKEQAVSCDFEASDLHRLWAHVCGRAEPYAAVMPCGVCGYMIPDSKVVLEAG